MRMWTSLWATVFSCHPEQAFFAKRRIWASRTTCRGFCDTTNARLARFLIGAIFSFAVLAFATPLFARSWRVTDFSDTISVGEDGSTAVHERITLEFNGEWHGIHRFIPIEYPGPRGTNYTLFLKVMRVTDGSGGHLKYESSRSHGFRDLKIYIPDAVDATRTVQIDYIVRNGIRFFEDHDEFYWNVTAMTGPCRSITPRHWRAFLHQSPGPSVHRPLPAYTDLPSAMRPPP